MTDRAISKPQPCFGWTVAVGAFLWLGASPASFAGNPPPSSASDAAHAYVKDIRPFMEQHCFDCHGEDKAKAGLRLDTLAAEFSAPDKARAWTKVLERIESGEMPPKKEPRPAIADQARTVKWLNAQLLAADAREQLPDGSLVLRRLNRLQYENTIHDLLSINLELKDRLPPDSRAFGFDNVGAALSLSSAQMEVYLQAAEAALDAAIVNRAKPQGIKSRRDPLFLPRASGLQERINGTIQEMNDVAIMYGPISFQPSEEAIPEDGEYRLRISMYTYHGQGKPVQVYIRSTHKSGDRVIGFFEAPLDSPGVTDVTCYLKKDARINISTSGLRYVPRKRVAAEQKDPGLAVQWVELQGPIIPAWPPESHQRLFGDLPMVPVTPKSKVLTVASQQPMADAERLLKSFMRRAYRRPVSSADLAPVLQLVSRQWDESHDFEDAMRAGYKVVLCSPDFLFFEEKKGERDEFALASRLSYFLWNTLPDEELLKLAEQGTLSRPENLHAQVERLLNHPKAKNFIHNFLDQWLDLRNIDSTTPDPKMYPEFDTALRQAMADEPEMFFEEVLKKDLGVANFLDSDFTFLNARLATHYGIDGVKGTEMRRVSLPPGTHRGGVMTMAAILKVTANGSYTHPVTRGVWLLRNIVGRPPDPPPPNAGAIEPDLRGAKTIKEQLNAHRRSANCAGCHVKIDPMGFALENFDVTGGWRDKYRILSGPRLSLSKNGPPIESSNELADGRAFQNIDDLKKLLLEDKEQMARCLTEKLMIYSTGMGLRFSDRAVIKEILSRTRSHNYGLRSIIHAIVQSPKFLNQDTIKIAKQESTP